ncbi:hypothetical protein [Telmatospirillum sp.]|uniref:hypothetical protein n=1 Tax=Telmatospirillum sp. TaxID=2079197 RepID=UPI00284E287D|nr:hypothetical protein [Telmatospirillum sp.]MDR3438247.1 hypothetical protein [Telmatospirillum sp.]
MTAEVGGVIHPVRDISLGGMRLEGIVSEPCSVITFVLFAAVDADGADKEKTIVATGLVLRHHRNSTAIAFQNATMPLMKMVVRQAARQLGIEPYLVK